MSKFVFTSFCFQNVSKPELTSAAWITDRNSEKWSQKGYHSLPFASKVSVRRSLIFKQSHSLNNRHGSFPHHSILPCNWTCHFLYKVKVFWPRVEIRQLIALFFLPFGTPDSGSKFRRYQVFIRYYWASAGITKGSRLWKRKRNVLRRDDYFYFHDYSFQICSTYQAWVGQYDWIYGKIPFLFCILLDFLKVLYFFPAWLCHDTSSFARSLRDLMHWSSLRSHSFKNLWEVDL